jgi:hypothetical protein
VGWPIDCSSSVIESKISPKTYGLQCVYEALKDAIHGTKFETDDDVIRTAIFRLCEQDKTYKHLLLIAAWQ